MWNSNMIIHIEETDSFNEEIEEKIYRIKEREKFDTKVGSSWEGVGLK